MAKQRISPGYKLLVIGGSAGALKIILGFLPGLRADLPFPVIIVLHRKSNADSVLTDLLASKTILPVAEAGDKKALCPGYIYIAPADYHLLIEKDGSLALDSSEKVNYSRPSIDVTFESAGVLYGATAACLLLSGSSADGSRGLETVKRCGGTTLVQDPATAEADFMPLQAIQTGKVDHIVKPEDMAALINTL